MIYLAHHDERPSSDFLPAPLPKAIHGTNAGINVVVREFVEMFMKITLWLERNLEEGALTGVAILLLASAGVWIIEPFLFRLLAGGRQ